MSSLICFPNSHRPKRLYDGLFDFLRFRCDDDSLSYLFIYLFIFVVDDDRKNKL